MKIIKPTMLLAIIVSLALTSVFAKENNTTAPRKKLSPSERKAVKANIERMMFKKNGGFVVKQGSAKGKIVFANCQNLVPAEKLVAPSYVIHKYLKVNTFNTNYVAVTCKTAESELKKLGASAGVFVVENNETPSMLIAPENKWAIVNVTALTVDKPNKEVLYSRLNKEILRAVAYLCGAVNSNYKGSILSCGNFKQLDSVPSEMLPIDVYPRMQEYLGNIDMAPAIISTYKKACEEGWAPAPTNDVQKAIWDKVHAMPTAPLKIKPETKKVVQ